MLESTDLAQLPLAKTRKWEILVKGWQNRATIDETIIREWWDRWPDAMPALPTGKKNGVAVLDIDSKNGKDGFKALAEAGHDTDKLTSFRCDTPSGGAHFYFNWEPGMGNSAAGLPAGVDVRGEGGFVIAPGAVAPSAPFAPMKRRSSFCRLTPHIPAC